MGPRNLVTRKACNNYRLMHLIPIEKSVGIFCVLKTALNNDIIVNKEVQYGKVDMQIIAVEIWFNRWN